MPTLYYPEDKQRLPEDAAADIRPGCYGPRRTVHLKTPLAKCPQGVALIGEIRPGQLIGPEAERKVAWMEYQMTERAIAKLEANSGIKFFRCAHYD